MVLTLICLRRIAATTGQLFSDYIPKRMRGMAMNSGLLVSHNLWILLKRGILFHQWILLKRGILFH